MTWRELITARSIIMLMCFSLGLGVGFCWNYSMDSARAPKEDLRVLKVELATLRKLPEPKHERPPAEFAGVRIPVFDSVAGPRVAEVTADRMMYPTSGTGKVYMTKPYVRRFTEDGKQLVMELWGDTAPP